MNDRILIVEDDKVIAELEKEYLTANGYDVDVCYDGDSGIAKAFENDYSLIILDVMLPGKNGFDICRELRQVKEIPILFVTAKQEDDDIVYGFDMGGNDYITKPFKFKEFVARVNSHVSRYKKLTKADSAEEIMVGSIKLCNTSRRSFVGDTEIQMTNKEFDLLWFLATNPNKVFTKEELLKKIWGYASVGDTSTVTVHVNRIREKLDTHAKDKQYIETIWGVGYRFRA